MKRFFIITIIVIGVLIMRLAKAPEKTNLTKTLRDQIKAEIKQAATEHLNSKDAHTALSHYTDDAIAATNTTLFPSLKELSEDVNAFYNILQEVNLAKWEEMYINIIDRNAALVTATCRYSFTNIKNERTDMKGIWTALYVRRKGTWKIRVRHESFDELDD